MTRLRVTETRANLSRIVRRVEHAGERVVLERRGQEVAALIPIEDLRFLEELEDRALIQAADAAEAASTAELTLDEMKARLGM